MNNAKVERYDLPQPHMRSDFYKPLVTLHLSDGQAIKTKLVVLSLKVLRLRLCGCMVKEIPLLLTSPINSE